MRLAAILRKCRKVAIALALSVLPPLTLVAYASPVPSEQVRVLMIRYEGARCVPYKIGGQWHAGIGHRLGAFTERFTVYTNDTIYDWFNSDLENAQRICRKGIKDFDDLPWDAQIAAIQLVWSCGPTGFMRFTDFRRQLSRQKFSRAAQALKKSLWWDQVGENRRIDVYKRLIALD